MLVPQHVRSEWNEWVTNDHKHHDSEILSSIKQKKDALTDVYDHRIYYMKRTERKAAQTSPRYIAAKKTEPKPRAV